MTFIFSGGFQPSFAEGADSRVVYGAVGLDKLMKGRFNVLLFLA
ncbi:MAG TPA: hypothetical protein PKY59_00555 [Pyrinomonadaceae bacterium]|nr:hypothetical protein [Pyrinomonadaceae bacterium]